MDEQIDLWKKIMLLYYLLVFFIFLEQVSALGLRFESVHDNRERKCCH